MYPEPRGAGQIVFNPATRTRQIVAHVAVTQDPTVVSLLLAQSDLMRPRGAYGTPDVDEYTRILRGMILPREDGALTVVRNDPLTGLPLSMYNLVPALAEDGSIVMIEEGLEEDMDEPGSSPDLTIDD